jgi:hypothetical protein
MKFGYDYLKGEICSKFVERFWKYFQHYCREPLDFKMALYFYGAYVWYKHPQIPQLK